MANQFIQDRSMPLVLHWLASMTPEVRAEVGDKAFLLGQLRQRGYPVLPGFVIATSMLPEFLLRSGIELPELATLPSDRPSPLQALARQLRRALLAAELPAAWLQSLVTACETMSSPVLLFRPSLSLEHGTPPAHLLLAQWCWQQPDAIAHGLKQTWAELLRARSLFYWQRLGLTWQQLHLAVLVQPARDAIASGTATSRGRLWQFQATRGLALSQERGETIPDTYQVEAATGRWQQRRGGHQSRIYRLRTRPPAVSADCVEIMALNEHDSLPMAITPDQQQQLLAIAVRLNADGVDVPGWEWLATPVALETEIILTQLHDQNPLVQSTSTAGPGSLRLLGIGAAPGQAIAPACLLAGIQKHWQSIPPNCILVIDHITPDWLPLLEQAAGLVIEQGGTTSHGAIVARELGIPGPSSVVADATQHLHNGDRLAIDGTSGEVCLLSSPSPATPPTSGLTLPLPRQ